jgi:hypothetical protein
MTRAGWITAGLGFGFALATLPAVGQAYSVQQSGGVVQEKPSTVLAIPAGDRATSEQLGKLFEAMRLREQVEKMRNIVPQMVEGQLRQQMQEMTAGTANSNVTQAQRAAAEKLVTKYVEKAANLYPVDEMIADMTTIYQRYLTREDVDGMIAFYSSPAGQHLLDAQPKIAQEYMPLVMSRVQERSKTLTAELAKDLAALKAASNAPPTQPVKK